MFFGKNLQRTPRRSQSRWKKHDRNRHPLRLSLRALNLECLEARQVLAATWEAMGPAPLVNGGVESVSPNNEATGAVHVVLAHPTDANILYAGAVNGGIWRTNNAQATSPTWTPLTDHMPSGSIGAMAMDPANPQRIIAGFGRYSSFSDSGSIGGLILTEDGGQTWRSIENPLFAEKNISGVAINGNRIIVTAGGGFHLQQASPTGGIFRSTDGGTTWTEIGVIPPDRNFPDELVPFQAYDLVADPTDSNRFYAGVGRYGVFAASSDAGGGQAPVFVGSAFEGVYRTDDGGATWSNVTNRDARITSIRQLLINNQVEHDAVEMAVSRTGRLYMTFSGGGNLFYIGYSDSNGGTWVEMDLPQTQESTGISFVTGAAYIHLSMVADPVDPYTVYIGGSTQIGDFIQGNAIGARDFTGRLFRGDTRQPSILNVVDIQNGQVPFNAYSPQWEHLTHSNRITTMREGGTRRSSSPHADSREMVFDANGSLIQSDDGGVYRRTLPRSNQGDWYSLNGNLQVTELHSIAYDSVSNVLIGGSQDNSALMQQSANSLVWQPVTIDSQTVDDGVGRNAGGDGGDVVVDDLSDPNFSYRYISSQSLGSLVRLKYNANNVLVEEKELVTATQNPFLTPVSLNRVNPQRFAYLSYDGVFESPNRGEIFYPVLGPNQQPVRIQSASVGKLVAGGRRNGVDNPDILYVGAGNDVFVRVTMVQGLRVTHAQFPGGEVRDIALDREDWTNAYVIGRDDIYVTHDIGANWSRVTGNLFDIGAGELRSLEFVKGPSGTGYVIVGTNRGAFVMSEAAPGKWIELGELPHVPVFEMEWDIRDNVLAVGTFGRGAFLMRDAARSIEQIGSQNVDPVIPPNTPSTTTGYVWNDLDGDGLKDDNEPGVAGITVYVDVNGDDLNGLGEPAAITQVGGGYQIPGVPAGRYAVRLALNPGWTQTAPSSGEHLVTTTAGSAINNLTFGVRQGSGVNSGFDYGDAPASFPTTAAQNGPSHGVVAGFSLGATIDGEADGTSSTNADADGSDEDGVSLSSEMVSGTNVTINVAIRNGVYPKGLLQGWIDFDGDGRWATPGEQIFTDQAVVEGVNSFVIAVPTWAKTGTSIARFRYGYERGLSFTGRALAGEVEDYAFAVVKGGPTANDDTGYQVRRNSRDNLLTVLANDDRRPNSGTVISQFTQGSSGGSVRLATNGAGLLYTPPTNFVGEETFTYTLTDNAGISDSATVRVSTRPDMASLSLVATDAAGNPITSIGTNQTFQLRGFVQDLTSIGGGVFAAYMDVEYNGAAASVTGPIQYGEDFPNGQSGDVTTSGLMDEIGAFDGIDRLGSAPGLLFIVPMRASRTGVLTFTANPADNLPSHNVLLFDQDDPVPTSEIEYGSVSISITGTPAAARTNPTNSLDVNNDTQVSPIDALLIINELNAIMAGEGEASPYYLDASSDGAISPIDALLVINELNRPRSAAAVAANSGEGESSASNVAAALAPSRSQSPALPLEPSAPATTVSVSVQRPVGVPVTTTESIFQEFAAASLNLTDEGEWDEILDELAS